MTTRQSVLIREKLAADGFDTIEEVIQDQAATIARLERELADAKPKAEAMDALATHMAKPGAWVAIWPDHVQVWQQDRKFGADTDKGLAAAIMDALGKSG